MDQEAQAAFRRAMGCFATGVAIVAVRSGDGVEGVTVNSFSSVSLDPPLVLWCLGDRSERYESFVQAETFGVTICAANEAERALRFAAKDREIADLPEWEDMLGVPVIAGGIARMACAVHARHIAGDHVILVGRVLALESRDGNALTYFRGRFGVASQDN
ncbi:MAG: flavin reductase [Alphaproteobacteria bacterium]|nr:flavin reductase [Alphaproteobacteria bacterium]